MRKKVISILTIFFISSSVFSQSFVKYMFPDSGYQGTSFPVTIFGDATEWTASSYFQIFFDSTGVTANYNTTVNDTTLTATVHINGKAVTIPRAIYVLDRFSNVYSKDSALKVLLSLPVVPTLLLPPNNSTNQFQNTTLLWDSNAYASCFRVQVSSDSIFSSPVLFDSTVANTPLQMCPNFLQLGTKYFWRVNATNQLGTSGWSVIYNFTVRETGITPISSEIPNSYKLLNNYPNPFNPVTKIRFQIPASKFVEIKIYDLTGKLISTLVKQVLNAGKYDTAFDASGLPSGIYIVKMQSENFTGIQKIAFVK